MKSLKNEKGFTLIEMLIVLAIIGIFIALAIPVYNNTIEKAKTEGCEANKHMLRTQAEVYFLENNKYPDDITALFTEKYLKAVPECPDGGQYSLITNTEDGSVDVNCDEH
jgi:prepilin-type N-terminal cleavage/methylation domain-containing protein